MAVETPVVLIGRQPTVAALIRREELVHRNFLPQRAYSLNDYKRCQAPSRTGRSGCETAFALTKEALWMVVLLSSLGLWAAIWATAASLASAWLQ